MAVYWLTTSLLFKEGRLRETAKALLAEVLEEIKVPLSQEGCWTLPGKKANNEGYRTLEWNGKRYMGHKLTYEVFTGEIPEGLYVLHSCDNPPCCNPDHLRAGTHIENMADKYKRDRFRSNGFDLRTHCPQGHEYTVENTYSYEHRRYCKQCHRVHTRNYQRRQRAKSKLTIAKG